MALSAIAPSEWLETLSEPVLVVTRFGTVVASNSAFRRIAGGAHAGRHLEDITLADQDSLDTKLRLWARTRQPVVESLRLRGADGPYEATVYGSRLSGVTRDGEDVFVVLRLVPRPTATRAFRILTDRVETLAREIAARKRAEDALRESEARFRTMADSAPVLIWLADRDGLCSYVNRQWLEFSGRRLEDELGRGWRDLLHPEDVEACLASLRQAFDSEQPFLIEYRLRRSDGEYRWLLAHGRPRYLVDGTFSGYVGSCTDITERRRAEEQLREINIHLEQRVAQRTDQLRDLAMRLAQTEQTERRRVAQVLHDDLQQFIVAAGMRAEIITRQTSAEPVLESVAQIKDLLERALQTSRSLTMQLSPPVLHEAGLEAGLDWLGRWMRKHHDLEVAVEASSQAEPLAEEVRVTLFLSARELLFNVVKHARAERATLTLACPENDLVSVTVADEGGGFDPDEIGRRRTDGGFGLFSVRQRIEHLGGSLQIASEPGKGTTVQILMPRHPRDHVTESGLGSA